MTKFRDKVEDWIGKGWIAELPVDQRAIWPGLLALAQKTPKPGVYALSNKKPLSQADISEILRVDFDLYIRTEKNLVRMGKLERSNKTLKLIDPKKYVSEYNRQLKYRKPKGYIKKYMHPEKFQPKIENKSKTEPKNNQEELPFSDKLPKQKVTGKPILSVEGLSGFSELVKLYTDKMKEIEKNPAINYNLLGKVLKDLLTKHKQSKEEISSAITNLFDSDTPYILNVHYSPTLLQPSSSYNALKLSPLSRGQTRENIQKARKQDKGKYDHLTKNDAEDR